MPDLTINSRSLDFVSDNVKVRFRHPTTGKPTTFTKAEILADSALSTELGNIMAPDATTPQEIKTGYVKNGSNQVLAVSTSVWASVYATAGEEIDYTREKYNSNIFLDETA